MLIIISYQSLLNEGVEGPEAIKKLRGIYDCWKDNIKVIELTGLLEAIDQAIKDGKTPLVLDRSADHKVDTFFSYRSAIILDAKKLGLDKGMRQIPVESLMKEIRQKLVGALKNGYPLIISMQQSACDFASTFNDEAEAVFKELDDLKEGNKYFPKEVFHKGGKDLVKDEFLDKIFRDEDKEGNVAFSRNPDTFQVVVLLEVHGSEALLQIFCMDPDQS